MSEPDLLGGGVGGLLGFDLFADEAGAVGDEAVDHVDVGAVDDAFEVVGEGDVLRHVDVGGDAGGSGVGGEGSGGVAGRGDGEVLQAVVASHGDGHRKAAGLEGAGGVGALLLDEEAGVALAVQHGGPALTEGDGGDGLVRCSGGEDVGVAPHAEREGRGGGAGGDGLAAGGALSHRVHVVTGVERPAQRGQRVWGVASKISGRM